jgi:AbrB family transcriptional regulator (stage V sporulation protein T)
MKATGIVRRIDDLGRVVIPKEIRRTMRIREGDPLEIYTSGEGEVVFKKYSPMGEMNQMADEYAQVLHKIGGLPVVICDKDRVVAVAGIPKKEMVERRVSPMLEHMMQNRKIIQDSDVKIKPVEGVDRYALVSYPIISSSDVCGAVMYVASEKETESNITQNKLIESAALLIGKQLES